MSTERVFVVRRLSRSTTMIASQNRRHKQQGTGVKSRQRLVVFETSAGRDLSIGFTFRLCVPK